MGSGTRNRADSDFTFAREMTHRSCDASPPHAETTPRLGNLRRRIRAKGSFRLSHLSLTVPVQVLLGKPLDSSSGGRKLSLQA
jgi:hypothetical protein